MLLDMDGFMYSWGFPLYLSIFIAISISNPYGDSLFTMLLKETYLPKLLGECSLAIYLFHQIMGYYINTIRCSVATGVNMFVLINAQTVPCSIVTGTPGYKWLQIIVAIIFSVFMQKVYQDRLVMWIYGLLLRKCCKSKPADNDNNNNQPIGTVF